MHDAKPVLTVLVLCGVGLLWLSLDWVSASAVQRAHRLDRIALEEAARSLPPAMLRTQAHWLLAHRLARLQGLSLLLGVGLLVGVGEGLATRRRDALAGVRLRSWTLGLLGISLLPGIVGGLVLCPVPWSVLVVAALGMPWAGLAVYLLASGAPHVA